MIEPRRTSIDMRLFLLAISRVLYISVISSLSLSWASVAPVYCETWATFVAGHNFCGKRSCFTAAEPLIDLAMSQLPCTRKCSCHLDSGRSHVVRQWIVWNSVPLSTRPLMSSIPVELKSIGLRSSVVGKQD